MDAEALKEEFEEYQLLKDEIEDDNSKTLGEVWIQILQLETLMGKRLHMFAKVVGAVVCLPHRNVCPCYADCERVFSLVRKVQTEFLKSLSPEVLTILFQCKINMDGCCDFEPQENHLSLAKYVTSECNEEHQGLYF